MKEKFKPNVFCDIEYCMFNRLWDGKRECTLNYMIRDELCPCVDKGDIR